MDFFDLLLHAGVITAGLVAYLILFNKSTRRKSNYTAPDWNYPLKLLCARYVLFRWKEPPLVPVKEMPQKQSVGWDSFSIRSSSPDGTTVLLGIRKICSSPALALAEVTVYVKLADGNTYRLPKHPDTVVGNWEENAAFWSAGGLKIQVLEPELRMRVLYNGLLTRVDDNSTVHAKMNFIWASACRPMRHPEDWSVQLAARALALEPWRDGDWSKTLLKRGEGSWQQCGTLQGRFESFDEQGLADDSVYLRTRGVRERSWAPKGYKDLRRSLTITAMAKDGTVVFLRGLSYKKSMTKCFSGWVRYAGFSVKNITSTDLIMSDFCETSKQVPSAYTINVSTSKSDLKLVLRINDDGGKLNSGNLYQHEVTYRSMYVDIDGEHGTGVLELGYETEGKTPVQITPLRKLKWLTESEAGNVGYCLSFEDEAAACTNYVGGKGASLALLASVQKEQGYRVPPGYCLTVHALHKHLEINPLLKARILEIEAANEDYDEKIFKEKCNETSELFRSTEITGELRDDILKHLEELRKKATEQNLGPELRFAVRSSAVGEDSEELSAAGQNETTLGCVTDDDVLKGVQQCWASMFDFNSTYYRRQNGQKCLCGGGVVIQALVIPRAAGVMFTKHPQNGDPLRLIITANYGLGESVVSGSVEPDTIIVSRRNNLSISQKELGSKTQRVATSANGITMVDVSANERGVACISDDEILKLAKIGVAQEELWGAGRDIEWGVKGDEIFLLQARPITSLERWTDEELLHELDFPIMSDDEIFTFANTGEVLPKPVSPLAYDMVSCPLMEGVTKLTGDFDPYAQTIGLTHNRCAIISYNSLYKKMPKEININIRMLEMSIHGHMVADEKILQTALHRRRPQLTDFIVDMSFVAKLLLTSKSAMKKQVRDVQRMDVDKFTNDDPIKLVEVIANTKNSINAFSLNHGITTAASSASQFIAMSVLLEGASDFTPEQCHEISTLLSSGDVLSAEVPQRLAKLTRQLEDSGKVEEFRAQDPKSAMEWIKQNLPQIYKDVEKFLEEHGHRAVMEFDLLTKPWILVPEQLMSVLQNSRSSKEEAKVAKTDAEVIAALKTPKKSSTKKVLRWVLPLCHRTVRHRETTKANLILAIHKVRLLSRHLGKLLVKLWYLPDEELVFFFRLHELRKYITTRDPALLKKAYQRQQYHPNWCKLKFAELNTGWIEPLKSVGPIITTGDLKINATSVCGGEIVARACVVKDLSEIGQLQRGDILITHSTDIGWSPYFPLLTGIVTELGGLISHGAVIAREYGLPCIVGASNATDLFLTGDTIRLSGTKGTLERVQIEKLTAEDSN